MTILQCMGGNCGPRDSCAHYHAPPVPGIEPSERLCGPTPEPIPVRWSQDRERLAKDPRFGQWAAMAEEFSRQQAECER
jgi:hypothetical protein